MVNEQQVRETVVSGWADRVLPSLSGLVEIPALSPAFDASWAANGQLQAAVDHVRDWIDARGLPGAKYEIGQLEGRSPLLLFDVRAPAEAADSRVLVRGSRPVDACAPPGPAVRPGLGRLRLLRLRGGHRAGV